MKNKLLVLVVLLIGGCFLLTGCGTKRVDIDLHDGNIQFDLKKPVRFNYNGNDIKVKASCNFDFVVTDKSLFKNSTSGQHDKLREMVMDDFTKFLSERVSTLNLTTEDMANQIDGEDFLRVYNERHKSVVGFSLTTFTIDSLYVTDDCKALIGNAQ